MEEVVNDINALADKVNDLKGLITCWHSKSSDKF